MVCSNPIVIYTTVPKLGMTTEVGCGKCILCRIKRYSEWLIRLEYESKYYNFKNKCFLTITYNDENIPASGDLCRRDVQLFLKRLRKNLKLKDFKYFLSGEYGENTKRPHYHAICFGMYPPDGEFLKMTKKGYKIYRSDFLDGCWSKGFVNYGHVAHDSLSYVVGYLFKKDDRGASPEFHLQSKGIGKRYCLDNKDKFLKDLCIRRGGREVSLPRYYYKLLGLSEDEVLRITSERNAKSKECKLLDKSLDEKDYFSKLEIIRLAARQDELNHEARTRLLRSRSQV